MANFDRFKGFLTLGENINKVKEPVNTLEEGVIDQLTPELTLDTEDEDLILLKKDWLRKWEAYNQNLSTRRKENEGYWKGVHEDSILSESIIDSGTHGHQHQHTLVDNLIFESLETFLPEATQKNPEPVVSADNTPEGEELSDKVRKMLIHLSDILAFKLKVKGATRNWAIYLLGVLKVTWNFEKNEMDIVVVRPDKLIFDQDAYITETAEYTGEYIGELKQDTAKVLVQKFPNKKKFIEDEVRDQMGTKVQYTEWWADNGRILFWTLKNEVLSKVRNPHWNYEEERTVTNEFGDESTESFTEGNHFEVPQTPYSFLSVFNLGLHPHDETSLIEQNIANQDLITKRYRQIDDNVDGMNGGWAISGERSGITREQARSAVEAFREGRGVWVPNGNINEAVQRMTGQGLPADVFNQLQDARNELRGIFGVQGSTPQGIQNEKTVRGKILTTQQDKSRTGGGVSEYIEQFSDRIFNIMVQFMYVYYDEAHVASIIGKENAFETIEIKNSDMDRKLTVSVKEGSMIPKDPLTQANQAIDLFGAGAIDPIELHSRLDDPNPRETVKQLVQFQTDPQSLFPEVQQPVVPEQGGMQGGVPPEQEQGNTLLSQVPIQ